jgi:hypothetical protein
MLSAARSTANAIAQDSGGLSFGRWNAPRWAAA